VTEPLQERARPETAKQPGTDVPGAGPRSMCAGVLLLLAAALAVLAGWWLLAEPVESPVLWTFDRINDHGVQEADLPGIAGLMLAAWLGLRGLGAWWRTRPGIAT
jgi:hypothetical protein